MHGVLNFVTLLGFCCAFGHDYLPETGSTCNNCDIKEDEGEPVEIQHDEGLGVLLLQTHMKSSLFTRRQDAEDKAKDIAVPSDESHPRDIALQPIGSSWPSPGIIALEITLAIVALFYHYRHARASMRQISKPEQAKGSDGAAAALLSQSSHRETCSDKAEPRLLHHRITSMAKSYPERIALIDGEVQDRFGHLQACALYVARHLVEERGIKPCSRTPIGVCAEGRHMMHAILGIVQTGNPYVPLPPNLPSKTRDFIVADAKIEVVLADPTSLAVGGPWVCRSEASPQHVLSNALAEDWAPAWEVKETDLAYILYTSGSTGKPKGVLAAHYSYYNRLEWAWRTYPFKEGEVGIQKTAIGWVDHVQEVFGVLGGGARLVLAPIAARTNPVQLLDMCREHSVTRLVLVPSLLRVIVGSFGSSLANELPCLRFWLVSGEPFPTDLLRAALQSAAPGTLVLNTYGTTEVAGDVSWAAYDVSSALPDSAVVPVGAAIPPNSIHLLDADSLMPVATGEPGEIFVEGPHVAVGYHNRPEEEEIRFVPLPHLGITRAFRTGDFGKLDELGMIQFLGRRDQQVKVHGQRVEVLQVEFELGEALSAMQGTSGVKAPCAVMAIPSNKHLGSYRLIAFVEMTNSIDASMEQTLRKHMSKALLPGHIPEAFIDVKSLPRLVNGKLDRVALKQTATELAGQEESSVSEDVDSFGQIRRTLVEYVNARRVCGTLSTLALALAILSHYAFEYQVDPLSRVWQMDCYWSTVVVNRLLCNLKVISIVVACTGALHGMGDESKFRFSAWEPCAILCWLTAGCVQLLVDHRNYSLYVLPEIILGRIWVISWDHCLRYGRLSRSWRTNVSSMLIVFSVYFFNKEVSKQFDMLEILAHDYIPNYRFFDLKHLVVYAVGFYVVPDIVKKPAESRSPREAFLFLCLFCIGLYNREYFLSIPSVRELLFRSPTLGRTIERTLYMTLELLNTLGLMGMMACMPSGIDLSMPGLAQLAAYVSFDPLRLWCLNGVAVFGVRLFPSLRDLMQLAGRLTPPLNGMAQLTMLGLYLAGYLLAFVGLYSLAIAGAPKIGILLQKLRTKP
jgi:amino acid adenylation domain-containing protein